jgi:hypothetical protein
MRHNTALTTPVALLAVAFVMCILSIAQADEHRGCSNATLNSSYGFVATGTLLALPAPFAGPFGEIGRQTFDGRGHTDGTGTLSANGNIVRVTVDGTYEVNKDCTGSMTLFILPFGATATFDFVIDDDGTEIKVIATDPGAVETRVYREQFHNDRRGK